MGGHDTAVPEGGGPRVGEGSPGVGGPPQLGAVGSQPNSLLSVTLMPLFPPSLISLMGSGVNEVIAARPSTAKGIGGCGMGGE